jgi:hypothetical protein
MSSPTSLWADNPQPVDPGYQRRQQLRLRDPGRAFRARGRTESAITPITPQSDKQNAAFVESAGHYPLKLVEAPTPSLILAVAALVGAGAAVTTSTVVEPRLRRMTARSAAG